MRFPSRDVTVGPGDLHEPPEYDEREEEVCEWCESNPCCCEKIRRAEEREQDRREEYLR